MRRWMYVTCLLFCINLSQKSGFNVACYDPLPFFVWDNIMAQQKKVEVLTPMEALDLVKAQYAVNFEKVEQEMGGEYYYKLPFAEYFLVYEGKGNTQTQYLIHLYEFVTDEIDTGISGRTAQKVSERLALMAKAHQVISITHLPQIASMADEHFIIEKTTDGLSTKTRIEILDSEKSVMELARMLGGVSITASVIASAKEMKELAMITKTKE